MSLVQITYQPTLNPCVKKPKVNVSYYNWFNKKLTYNLYDGKIPPDLHRKKYFHKNNAKKKI